MGAQEPGRKLGEYLLHLVMSPDLRAHFELDPKSAVAASGLNDAKQKILLSGDLNQILDELAGEYGSQPGDHTPG
jgi:hypothetical protein